MISEELVFYCNYMRPSILHHFVYNEVLKSIKNDVTAKFPLGGALKYWYKFILKEKSWLPISVLKCDFTSLMHRFVDIEVLLLTGNDAIARFQLGGAACEFWLEIL